MTIGLLITYPLWLSRRLYPLVPIVPNWPVVVAPWDLIIFLALIGCLSATAVVPRPRKFLAATIILLVILGLADQTRWQPWVFQYTAMLITLALLGYNKQNYKKQQALNACRFIVASIYIFSGLQKLNISFIKDVLPYFAGINSVPLLVGLAVAGTELFIGLGLITKRFRHPAIILAVLMPTAILYRLVLIEPYNVAVWPWNVAMMSFALILFWNTYNKPRAIISPHKSTWKVIILIMFGLLPIGSWFGVWDMYLSGALYSGNKVKAEILIDGPLQEILPIDYSPYTQPTGLNTYVLPISSWSYQELQVPTYPEERVFRNIGNSVCSASLDPDRLTLVLRGKPTIFRGERIITTFSCSTV